MTEHIEHRLEDGITYITINDPKNGNRVSDPMAEELSLQIDAASESSKAVVLRTMGDDFCLGRSIRGEKPGKLPEAYKGKPLDLVVLWLPYAISQSRQIRRSISSRRLLMA